MRNKMVLYAQYQGVHEGLSPEDYKDFKKLEKSRVLEKDTYYKVKDIRIGNCFTNLYLDEIPSYLNGSVFKYYDIILDHNNKPLSKKEHDIYKDPRFDIYKRGSVPPNPEQ